jgi:hypothetical protein
MPKRSNFIKIMTVAATLSNMKNLEMIIMCLVC